MLADRVKETSTTTGTGPLTLLGADTGGFRTFAQGFPAAGASVYYAAQMGADWEVGEGTHNAGVLTRVTVLASSNAGALVNFGAGTKTVFNTTPAAFLTAQQTAINGKQATLVSGTNIKTVNGASLLGAGDLVISGGGGLTLFEESRSIAAPNATIPVHGIKAIGTETNIDFVIGAKGTGAVLAHTPDGTSTGGNKRGTAAVDLQLTRSAADQVASGAGSFVVGNGCTASGLYAVAAGSSSRAIGNTSVAFGSSNAATGNGSVAIGSSCSATGYASLALGAYSYASRSLAVAIGDQCTASGAASFATGAFTDTRSVDGAFAEGTGAAAGRQQMERIPLRLDTTTATPAQLTTTGSTSPSIYNVAVMPNNSAYYCRVRMLARNTSTNECMSWVGTALVRRGANAAATVVVGNSLSSDFGDAAMAACAVSFSADTTRGALAVNVTGLAGATVRWVGQIETVEAA